MLPEVEKYLRDYGSVSHLTSAHILQNELAMAVGIPARMLDCPKVKITHIIIHVHKMVQSRSSSVKKKT